MGQKRDYRRRKPLSPRRRLGLLGLGKGRSPRFHGMAYVHCVEMEGNGRMKLSCVLVARLGSGLEVARGPEPASPTPIRSGLHALSLFRVQRSVICGLLAPSQAVLFPWLHALSPADQRPRGRFHRAQKVKHCGRNIAKLEKHQLPGFASQSLGKKSLAI